MSGVVETRKLGLAAYIKMQGGELQGVEQDTNTFQFRDGSEKTVQQWEFEYVNSCCHRHDTELVNLRKLLRR
jgi:hypothetical protein